MKVTTVPGETLSSNSFLVTDETTAKVLVVDIGGNPALNNYALKKALLGLQEEKQQDIEIEVFFTHCHFDHTAGEKNLDLFPNKRFSASKLTAKHLNERDIVTLFSIYPSTISYKVEKIYEKNEKIIIGDIELEVIYSPGHTDGGAVLFEPKTKALFVGDNVIEQYPGRVDLPTGNRKVLIATLEKLAQLGVEKFYSGHGPNITKNATEAILQAKRALEYY